MGAPLDRVVGTWTGESICAGNRPASRNEVVVYRIEPISERSVMLFADKVIDGKRVPTYNLEFTWDSKTATLSAEFVKRQTHGLWRYHLSGEVLAGTLVLLPHKELGRRINVHRVPAGKVPAAPADSEYDS